MTSCQNPDNHFE